jgi:hypothetical protein
LWRSFSFVPFEIGLRKRKKRQRQASGGVAKWTIALRRAVNNSTASSEETWAITGPRRARSMFTRRFAYPFRIVCLPRNQPRDDCHKA